MNNFRNDFPIFEKDFDPNGIIYLDSAATTLKPQTVISRVLQFYEHETSNVSRGNHFLSEKNYLEIEDVRSKVASFIKCHSSEIVFTQNATDSINIVAQGLKLKHKDEIIVSVLEHHSNYLPWLNKAKVKIAPVNKNLEIDLKKFEKLISSNTRLIAISYASNITGNVNPIEQIIKIAKKRNILVLIDAAQAISHFPINIAKLGCDFLVFSAHKMFGPSGVGVLYVKKDAQKLLKPQKFGGGMTNKVSAKETTFKEFPYLMEAGTPNIEGILGFGKALDYFTEKGFNKIKAQLDFLEKYLKKELLKLDFIKTLPISSKKHLPIFTFFPVNPASDINLLTQTLSDAFNIIARGGFHCCQLIYNDIKLKGGIRVSLHVYNTKNDIDMLIDSLKKMRDLF